MICDGRQWPPRVSNIKRGLQNLFVRELQNILISCVGLLFSSFCGSVLWVCFVGLFCGSILWVCFVGLFCRSLLWFSFLPNILSSRVGLLCSVGLLFSSVCGSVLWVCFVGLFCGLFCFFTTKQTATRNQNVWHKRKPQKRPTKETTKETYRRDIQNEKADRHEVCL